MEKIFGGISWPSHSDLTGMGSESESVISSVMSDSLQPYGLVAFQAPLSVEFSRQEYWNGLLFPSPGNRPNLGMEPMSPAL